MLSPPGLLFWWTDWYRFLYIEINAKISHVKPRRKESREIATTCGPDVSSSENAKQSLTIMKAGRDRSANERRRWTMNAWLMKDKQLDWKTSWVIPNSYSDKNTHVMDICRKQFFPKKKFRDVRAENCHRCLRHKSRVNTTIEFHRWFSWDSSKLKDACIVTTGKCLILRRSLTFGQSQVKFLTAGAEEWHHSSVLMKLIVLFCLGVVFLFKYLLFFFLILQNAAITFAFNSMHFFGQSLK